VLEIQKIDFVAIIIVAIVLFSAFLFAVSSKIYHPPSHGIEIFAVCFILRQMTMVVTDIYCSQANYE
jgi:hypothetical protein